MTTKAIVCPTNKVLHELAAEIDKTRNNHPGLVTVICPTNTTAVFLRRQYEQLQGKSIFVRFSTIDDVMRLLDDATLSHNITSQSETIHHFDICVQIAQELFGVSQAWVKVPLVKTTLIHLASLNEDAFARVIHDYPLAKKCFDAFTTLSPRHNTHLSQPLDVASITGSMIVYTYGNPDRATEHFLTRYRDNIVSTLVASPTKLHTKLHVAEDVTTEIDYILSTLLDSPPSFTTSCIIVPDNNYKRLVIAYALRKGIPLAGNSPDTVSSHPFCTLAQYLLETAHRPVTSEMIQDFTYAFPWIENPAGSHPVVDCKDKLMQSSTVGEYFNHITNFISHHVRAEYFHEDNDYGLTSDETRNIFSALHDLSTSTSRLSRREALDLLWNKTSHPLRIGKLGYGVYVALASEVFGSTFEHTYICGMNDTYVPASKVSSSLIPRDQYEMYGIRGITDAENHSQNVMSWLRSCSEQIVMTSTKRSSQGKTTALPHWAELEELEHAGVFWGDFAWDEGQHLATVHMENLFSHEVNTTNAAVSPHLIADSGPFSATGLEVMASCPSMFLHSRLLKARTPQESPDPDNLLPTLFGTFIHDQLNTYISSDLTREELSRNVAEHILQLQEKNILPHSASRLLTTERALRIINNFFILHENAQSTSLETEHRVEGELNGHPMRGTIDRFEHAPAHILVDYKTGKNPKINNEFEYGRRIQLAVYAELLHEDVTSLQYWYLGDDSPSSVTIEWNNDIRDDARVLIDVLMGSIENGLFLAREEVVEKLKKGTRKVSHCDRCENEPYCYQEHKALWPTHKKLAGLDAYVRSMGEIEEGIAP